MVAVVLGVVVVDGSGVVVVDGSVVAVVVGGSGVVVDVVVGVADEAGGAPSTFVTTLWASRSGRDMTIRVITANTTAIADMIQGPSTNRRFCAPVSSPTSGTAPPAAFACPARAGSYRSWPPPRWRGSRRRR